MSKVNIFPQLEPEMPPKPALASKTIWANMAIIAVGVLTYLQGHELIMDNPTVVSVLAVAVGIGNVILRLVTDRAVK